MSANADLARLFSEMAAALELAGANPFRVRALARVARIAEESTVDLTSLPPEELAAIEGIGPGTAKKIREFAETGDIAEHAELWSALPRGLLEVMRVPGLGPKTVKALWEKGGVTDLATLQAKLEDGSLECVPRMGAKSLQKLRESLAFLARCGGRVRLGTAMEIAERIVELLRRVPGAARVEFAGSLRRGKETIGDVDVLACGSSPQSLAEAFVGMAFVDQVIAAGETKCSVRLASGVQADLRLVDEAAFGAALLYFTGSKEHNVRLRERAIARGFRLNEYGLFPEDGDPAPPQARGVRPVAAATEEEIYAALGLPWIPPELREERVPLEAPLPALVELGDIRAELHAHTTASDGALTIDELIAAAAARGFHTVAVTDHSRSSFQANGLTPERLLEHIAAVRAAARRHPGMRVLAGSEVDIHPDGTLDYDDELLRELDLVVASPHASLRQAPELATHRLVRAASHPLVHILGHPTGRLINEREGLQPDIAAVAAAASAAGTAMEVNANDWRLDLRDVHVRAALDAGCDIAINCDVHGLGNFDQLRYGVVTARRGGLPRERCVNAWDAEALEAWRRRKRVRAGAVA